MKCAINTKQYNLYNNNITQQKRRISFRAADSVTISQNSLNIEDKELARNCAIFSYNAYPQKDKIKLPQGVVDISADFEHLPLGEIRYKVFLNQSKKQVIIAYSGTYDKIQLAKNTASLLTTIPRQYFALTDSLCNSVKNKYSDYTMIITGHSAGGGLAQYSAAKHDVYGITFAPAGIKNNLSDLGIGDRKYPKIVNYISENDLVTYPYFKNIGQDYLVDKVKTHSLSEFLNPAVYKDTRKVLQGEMDGTSVTEMLGEYGSRLRGSVQEQCKNLNNSIDDAIFNMVEGAGKLFGRFFK